MDLCSSDVAQPRIFDKDASRPPSPQGEAYMGQYLQWDNISNIYILLSYSFQLN